MAEPEDDEPILIWPLFFLLLLLFSSMNRVPLCLLVGNEGRYSQFHHPGRVLGAQEVGQKTIWHFRLSRSHHTTHKHCNLTSDTGFQHGNQEAATGVLVFFWETFLILYLMFSVFTCSCRHFFVDTTFLFHWVQKPYLPQKEESESLTDVTTRVLLLTPRRGVPQQRPFPQLLCPTLTSLCLSFWLKDPVQRPYPQRKLKFHFW